MNQILETALQTYVSPQLDDWDEHLPGFSLSYNGTPHSATGFSPALLLYGYQPENGDFMPYQLAEEVDRSKIDLDLKPERLSAPDQAHVADTSHNSALELRSQFQALRTRAKDALTFAQASFTNEYNRRRLAKE